MYLIQLYNHETSKIYTLPYVYDDRVLASISAQNYIEKNYDKNEKDIVFYRVIEAEFVSNDKNIPNQEEKTVRQTGIVRRIDDLGRIVIPKAVREEMEISTDDPIELYIDTENKSISLKKYGAEHN